MLKLEEDREWKRRDGTVPWPEQRERERGRGTVCAPKKGKTWKATCELRCVFTLGHTQIGSSSFSHS